MAVFDNIQDIHTGGRVIHRAAGDVATFMHCIDEALEEDFPPGTGVELLFMVDDNVIHVNREVRISLEVLGGAFSGG